MTDVPTMTRASMLPDWEYFEYTHGFGPLFLTVAKGVSLMVSEGYTKLAPSFASGTDKAEPSPLAQNLFSQARKHPRVAATPEIIGKIIYGESYDMIRANERVDEQLARVFPDAPPSTETNDLSYGQCLMAVRSGALPSGRSLEASLDGVKGRVVVVDLCGVPGSGDFLRSAARLKLAPLAHAVPLMNSACSDYLSVGAARLLASTDSPFHLTDSDVQSMLTPLSLPVLLQSMVQRDEDDTDGSIPLSREEMIQAAVAWGPAEAVAELPWLALQATPHTRLSDSVLEMGAAFEYLQKTMNQYEEGPPARHIAIVANAQGEFFACCWQVTLKHMKELETAFVRARGDARGDARTQAQASSSAAASSSSTAAPHQHGVPSLALSDVVAAGRAALARAAAEVQACVPQPWSYAYTRRAALVHSHSTSTGNARKGVHRRRPSEFDVCRDRRHARAERAQSVRQRDARAAA